MTSAGIGMRHLLGQRSPRERRLIGIATLVVAAAAVLMVADWSISERERVRTQLPQARAALAEMQTNSASLQNLANRRAPTWPTPDAAAEIVMASARAHDIALEVESTGTSLTASGRGRLPAVLSLVANLQSDFGLRPNRVTLNSRGEAVTFEIEFVSPSS